MLDLLADVRVQVAGETEDIAHHLVGDHVTEKATRVGEDAGVFDELGKHVVLEAGRERLHPRQAIRPRQHGGGDLADERVRSGHGGLGLDRTGGVDPLGTGGGRLQCREPLGLDGGINHELHGEWSRRDGDGLPARRIDKHSL